MCLVFNSITADNKCLIASTIRYDSRHLPGMLRRSGTSKYTKNVVNRNGTETSIPKQIYDVVNEWEENSKFLSVTICQKASSCVYISFHAREGL